MEINEFVKNFAAQFEKTDPGLFTVQSKFRDFDEWDSLIALSVIAMADAEYGVIIKGDDIIKSQTIEDLFNIMKSRK